MSFGVVLNVVSLSSTTVGELYVALAAITTTVTVVATYRRLDDAILTRTSEATVAPSATCTTGPNLNNCKFNPELLVELIGCKPPSFEISAVFVKPDISNLV